MSPDQEIRSTPSEKSGDQPAARRVLCRSKGHSGRLGALLTFLDVRATPPGRADLVITRHDLAPTLSWRRLTGNKLHASAALLRGVGCVLILQRLSERVVLGC